MTPAGLFAGATPSSGGLAFSLAGADGNDIEVTPTQAEVVLTINRNGTISGSGNFASPNGNWITPANATIGDSYEVEFHVVSGDTPSGTLDTWLALTANRSVSFTTSGIGPETKSCLLRVIIRLVAGSVEKVRRNDVALDANEILA